MGKTAADAAGWWVYMIRSRRGRLYTGITTDVERRFSEHCGNARRGAKFFRTDPAEEVVYRLPCADRSEASRREAAIKKLSREGKLKLLADVAADV